MFSLDIICHPPQQPTSHPLHHRKRRILPLDNIVFVPSAHFDDFYSIDHGQAAVLPGKRSSTVRSSFARHTRRPPRLRTPRQLLRSDPGETSPSHPRLDQASFHFASPTLLDSRSCHLHTARALVFLLAPSLRLPPASTSSSSILLLQTPPRITSTFAPFSSQLLAQRSPSLPQLRRRQRLPALSDWQPARKPSRIRYKS